MAFTRKRPGRDIPSLPFGKHRLDPAEDFCFTPLTCRHLVWHNVRRRPRRVLEGSFPQVFRSLRGRLFRSSRRRSEKAVCSGSGERSESCFPRFSLQGIYLYIPVENVGNRFPHPAAGVFSTLFQTLFFTGVENRCKKRRKQGSGVSRHHRLRLIRPLHRRLEIRRFQAS